jgi:hypothetical protein
MRRLALVLLLTGCGWTNTNLASPPVPPAAPPPDPWVGIERLELELHPLYSVLPRAVAPLSDGRELWTYEDGEACRRQFLIAGPVVQGRRLIGQCPPRCAARPTSRPCTPGEANSEQQASTSARVLGEVIKAAAKADVARQRAIEREQPVVTDCQDRPGGVRCVTR